jgi:hypothetical protein
MAHKKFSYDQYVHDLIMRNLVFLDSNGEPLLRAYHRSLREERQRQCAARRVKIMRRSKPKAVREQEVRDEREAKYASLLSDDIDFEAGVPAIISAGAAVIAAISGAVIARGVSKNAKSIADSVDTLSKAASEAADEATTTLSGVNEFFRKIHDAIKAFVDLVKSIGGIFWKLVIGAFVVALRSLTGIAIVIQDFALGILSKLVPDVSTSFDFEEGDIEPQSSNLASSVAAMMSCIILPTASASNRAQLANSVFRNISMLPKAAEGFEALFGTIMRMTQAGVNAVLKMVGKEEVSLVGAAEAEVLKWCKECDKVIAVIDCEKPEIAKLIEAKSLLVMGYNMKSTMQAQHLRRTIEHQLDKLNSKIAPFRGLLDTEGTYRMQPLFVMFGGDSATGKTYLVKAFTTACLVMAGLCEPEMAAHNMFQKGEDRFFNGYSGQAAYIMDDVFQKKPVPGSDECEAMTVIKAVNSWPFPLPFADVESKGRFFFNSKLMVGTTNEKNISGALDPIITCPKAVLRRISHGYWMSVNESFKTQAGSFNYRKWELEQQARFEALGDEYTTEQWLNSVPWEAWSLEPCGFDGISGGVGPRVIDLVKDVAHQLSQRTAAHAENVSNIFNWALAFKKAKKAVGIEPQSGPVMRTADVCDLEDESIGYARSEFVRNCDSIGSECDLDAMINEDGRDFWAGMDFRPKVPQDEADVVRCGWTHWARKEMSNFRLFMELLVQQLHQFTPGPWIKQYKRQWRRRDYGGIAWVTLNLLSTLYVGVKVLGLVFKAVRGVVGAIRNLLFGKPEGDGEEADDAEEQSVHRDVDVKPKPRTKYPPPSAKAENGGGAAISQSDRVYRNTYKVFADGEPVGQILMVRNRIGVMPFHFRKVLTVAKSIEMLSCNGVNQELRYCFSGAKFAGMEHVDYEDSDLCFVDFSSACMHAHRDLVKQFIADRDFQRDFRTGANIGVRLDVARDFAFEGKSYVQQIGYVVQGVSFEETIRVKGAEVKDVYTYTIPTQAGDCGAMLTITEPRYFAGKSILGMHIAGRSLTPGSAAQRQGYAAVLTHELVVKTLSKFSNKAAIIEDTFHDGLAKKGITLDDDGDIVEEMGLADGSFTGVGLVDKSVSQSTRSKLIPSGCEVFGPCPMKPAILSPVVRDGVVIEPMVKAMSNYMSTVHLSDIPNADAVMALAMKQHWLKTAKCTRRLLTLEESVLGVPHLKLKSVNRSSSCGYPLCLEFAKGKKDIFGDGQDYDLTSEASRKVLLEAQAIIDDARRGVRRPHIFVDFLKDELRTSAKVDDVQTRAISGAPLPYVLACRIMFGAFISSVHIHNVEVGMAPGINHHSEWGHLAHRLLKPGGRVFAGDFKAFDASEQPDIHAMCLKYINKWYEVGGASAEDQLAREVLFLDLVHSRHLTGGGCIREAIVQWHKSLPSGHPLTTIVNSMYSLFTLTACYVKRTRDLTDMWEKAYICTYGDDNVSGVSDEVSEVFNQETVAEDMKDFKLVYTSDRKDGVLRKYESIYDITFLKRYFVDAECDSGWAGPLTLDSILYRIYYYRSNKNFARDMEANVESLLIELSMHSEEEWTDRYNLLREYCLEANIPLAIVSRDQARSIFFSRDDTWF